MSSSLRENFNKNISWLSLHLVFDSDVLNPVWDDLLKTQSEKMEE